jgi:hypothetical protein
LFWYPEGLAKIVLREGVSIPSVMVSNYLLMARF